jgi:hypothetical protein
MKAVLMFLLTLLSCLSGCRANAAPRAMSVFAVKRRPPIIIPRQRPQPPRARPPQESSTELQRGYQQELQQIRQMVLQQVEGELQQAMQMQSEFGR